MKTRNKILNLIKQRPMTALEIGQKLGSEGNKISRSGLYSHLNRLVTKKEIGFLSKSDSRIQTWNTKKVIEEGYNLDKGVEQGIQWSKKSERIYARTKKSGKLYKRLIKK